MKCKLHYGLCTLYHTNRKCSNRDLRTKAVKATDTESGKNHFILRLSQSYKYTIQIEKLFLAVDLVPAQIPEQIVVPVSPQLPGLAVQCFGVDAAS